jgi:hypothetical protein
MEAERFDNVSVISLETAKAENTNTENGGENTMDDALLKAGYAAQQKRIEQLESWVIEAIGRPSMPRDLRLQGLEIIEERGVSPEVSQAVERICPTRTQGLERSLEIER